MATISKTNLAVDSHPDLAAIIAKVNLAVNSRPAGAWAVLSKTNLAVTSNIFVAARRRLLFLT